MDTSIHGLKNGSNRIKKIVESLRTLSFSHKMKKQNTNLNLLIDEAFSFSKTLHSDKQIELKWTKKQLPEINCDTYGVKQAFIQILLNSFQAIENEGIINIDCEYNDNNIWFYITDNGTGIKQDIITKVFDPFFTTKEVGQGVGLGLTICHGIIEGHNGTIDIESSTETCTKVSIKIPVG